MKLFKIALMVLTLPVLLTLQAALNTLAKAADFCTGLLTLILSGFLIHHLAQGNWDNVILLCLSLMVCIGIPAVLQILASLLQWLTAAVIS